MATFTRRRLLSLSAGGALALLGSCASSRKGSLLHSPASLPGSWLSALPKDWQARSVAGPQQVLEANNADLIQLNDGWATTAPADAFAPLGPGIEPLLQRLDPFSAPISRLLAPAGKPVRAFPWACGTWVLLVRERPDLLERAAEGWSVLLDPSLKGKLVLPSSPRVVISLLAGSDGWQAPALAEQLRRLRSQALAFDDRDGLNLLLHGEAEAIVLPSQRALALLRRDPRLQALQPLGATPLIWDLLLRPKDATRPLPLAWLARVLQEPGLSQALNEGWLPPLPRARLQGALARQPAALRPLLLPAPELLSQCHTLAPLTAAERASAQALWDATAPLRP